jgi:hypothetical protein
MKSFIFSITFLFIISCKSNKAPLFAKDGKNENERNNNLLVFVTEPIGWEYLPPDSTSMDEGFKVKCKIIQNIYGEYNYETIEFESYDHYGVPAFLKYKNVLLFLVKKGEKYYQVKYQFNDVYKTKNGRWAGVYWSNIKPNNSNIKLEKIEFQDTIFFPAIYKDEYGDDEDFPYGEPYFKLVGNKKIPIYGNYVEEIFKIKKEGIFSDWGYFGMNNKKEIIEPVETEMAELKMNLSTKDDLAFSKSYNALLGSIYKVKLSDFKLLVSDTLKIFDSIVITKSLTDTSFKYLFKQKILKKYNGFLDLTNNEFTLIDSSKFSKSYFKNKIKEIEKTNSRILIMSYNFNNKNSKRIALRFLRTKNGFKLKNYEYVDFPIKTTSDASYYFQ